MTNITTLFNMSRKKLEIKRKLVFADCNMDYLFSISNLKTHTSILFQTCIFF